VIVSLSMMKQFLGSDVNIDDIMHRLEHHLEVEIEEVYDIVPAFYDIVVGRIVDKKDKGYIVSVGDKELFVSSFGTTELPRYMHVPVAPVGATIGDITVEKRGGFDGIIPTLSMLGIPDVAMLPAEGGVPVFPYDVEVGTPLEEALGMPDKIFDIYIAPPRGDLGSVWGFVRELGRIFHVPIAKPDFPSARDITQGQIVSVESLEDTPIYAGVLIKGVRIEESPWQLQRTLAYLGIRPIYNVVDITNYYLAVYGQPMHAFDYDKVVGGISVRRAREGESIVTLDGIKRQLDRDILVIADHEKPIAIAGVMGGENTEVSEDTENIFLEVAYFTPIVARSSRKLSLRTDASYRFERGIDPSKISAYAKMAAADIVKVAGGEIVSMEKVGSEWDTKEVLFKEEKADILMGQEIDWREEIISLGFQYEDGKAMVPSYRHNLRNDRILRRKRDSGGSI